MTDSQDLLPNENTDAQINRRGRPLTWISSSSLPVTSFMNRSTWAPSQFACTRLEALLREWFTSDDFRKQKAVI